MKKAILILLALSVISCKQQVEKSKVANEPQTVPFLWENASVYFLLTDRFNNGDTGNDFPLNRKRDGDILRSFEGGDIRGIIQKIDEGYFDRLGINAIWMTPLIEQIHGWTDEGTGKTYGYHGYWAKDWTNIDPNYGTMADLKELVDKAHQQGIRIMLDVVINHTGPVTGTDMQWPDEWVRTEPVCTHSDYLSSVTCTLVENLPDIRTESNKEVELPSFLIEKWKKEDRYEQELKELDDFFTRTGYPRAPRYYIIKWLADYVRELGVDGFRVDTAKHTEASVWLELFNEVSEAFKQWKRENPEMVLDENEFFMVGEVYGYGIQGGLYYNYGDTSVNFFDQGLRGLINFSLKSDALKQPEDIFSEYASLLHRDLEGKVVMSYLSSHDDSGPFDLERNMPFESGTKLMLTPGAVQIYYGDELARPLTMEGTQGDAGLRTCMNWEELAKNADRKDYRIGDVFDHWSKLAHFRKEHPAVGAGKHEMISRQPYIFKRIYTSNGYHDAVLVVMDGGLLEGPLDVSQVFNDGDQVKDYYSGQQYTVEDGKILIASTNELLLLGKPALNM